jgi:hypothetical protein
MMAYTLGERRLRCRGYHHWEDVYLDFRLVAVSDRHGMYLHLTTPTGVVRVLEVVSGDHAWDLGHTLIQRMLRGESAE